MSSELVRQLVDAGIHYGHRASRWNPKMAPYIYGKRNTIHIIDIRETVKGLLRAKRFIAQVIARGDDVLFVGTKRQAKLSVMQEAQRVGMPFVIERWLGGTLTNYRTIRSRLSRLDELETAVADGTALEYSKKMMAMRSRELFKIKRNLEGIRGLDRLPGALIVVDVHRERNALREARKLGIPTVCLIDTDSDPDFADLPIPGNDDAIRAIGVVLRHLADAVEEGKKGRMAAVESDGESDGQGRRRARRGSGRSPEGRAGEGGDREAAAVAREGGRVRADDSDLTPASTAEPDAPA